MTDLRARLADTLREHSWDCDTCNHDERSHELHLAEVLLSLPGVAIVEVPEYAYVSVRYSRDGMIARLNAKEEAAANTAEKEKS
jgi:hypothetical protein